MFNLQAKEDMTLGSLLDSPGGSALRGPGAPQGGVPPDTFMTETPAPRVTRSGAKGGSTPEGERGASARQAPPDNHTKVSSRG